jgi:hypothetical protein
MPVGFDPFPGRDQIVYIVHVAARVLDRATDREQVISGQGHS